MAQGEGVLAPPMQLQLLQARPGALPGTRAVLAPAWSPCHTLGTLLPLGAALRAHKTGPEAAEMLPGQLKMEGNSFLMPNGRKSCRAELGI